MSAAPPLAQLLGAYLNTALGTMAAALGLTSATKGKQALVTLLSEALPRPDRVGRSLAALDPTARQALDLMVLAGGRASWDSMLLWTRLGMLEAAEPRLTPRAYGEAAVPAGDPKSTSGELHHVLARLELAGLALGEGNRASDYTQRSVEFGRARAWVIPAEVLPHLPVPPGLVIPSPDDPAAVAAADPRVGQRQLFLLWSWIWRAEPQVLKGTGGLAKREVKRLAADLPYWVAPDRAEEDQDWLAWAHRMLLRLGLLRDDERSHGLEPAAGAFWVAPLSERLHRCLVAAGAIGEPLELLAAGQPPSRNAARTWTGARGRIWEQLLAFYPAIAGAWIGIRGLERALTVRHRDFLVPPVSAYLVRSYYGGGQISRYSGGLFFTTSPAGAGSDPAGWDVVERPFIRRVLTQLWRLGLVDLGLGKDAPPPPEAPPQETITHVRLSAWGRHMALGEPPPSEAEQEARVVLQPNFQILVMGPLPEDRLMTLERIADRTGADRAIAYTLSRDSVYRAQRAGIGVAAILGSLRDLTGAEPPQNVARSLQDWQQQHERIVFDRRVTLLQAFSPEAARGAAEAVGPDALQDLGEGFLLVRQAEAAARYARERDLMVEEEDARRPSLGVSLTVDADGQARPLTKCVDPWDLGHLQCLTEGDLASGFRITLDAVRRAHKRYGLDAHDQLAMWRAEATPLPGAMVRLVQRGTGHFGQATLRRGAFVELPSAEALAALGERPELAAAYRKLNLGGPMLWVDEARLEDVRAAMAELGLEVAEGDGAGAPGGDALTPAATPKRRGRPPNAR